MGRVTTYVITRGVLTLKRPFLKTELAAASTGAARKILISGTSLNAFLAYLAPLFAEQADTISKISRFVPAFLWKYRGIVIVPMTLKWPIWRNLFKQQNQS